MVVLQTLRLLPPPSGSLKVLKKCFFLTLRCPLPSLCAGYSGVARVPGAWGQKAQQVILAPPFAPLALGAQKSILGQKTIWWLGSPQIVRVLKLKFGNI